MKTKKYSNSLINEFLGEVIPVICYFWKNGKGGYRESDVDGICFWRKTKKGKVFNAVAIPDEKYIKIETDNLTREFDDPSEASDFLLRSGLNLSPIVYKPIKNNYRY